MVAVQNLDVHARMGHGPAEQAQLTRPVLVEALHQNLSDGDDRDACCLERRTRKLTVRHEEVSDTDTSDDPHAAALDAHAPSSQRLAHQGKLAGFVPEFDLEVKHGTDPR